MEVDDQTAPAQQESSAGFLLIPNETVLLEDINRKLGNASAIVRCVSVGRVEDINPGDIFDALLVVDELLGSAIDGIESIESAILERLSAERAAKENARRSAAENEPWPLEQIQQLERLILQHDPRRRKARRSGKRAILEPVGA
jgi:hypothetical protein